MKKVKIKALLLSAVLVCVCGVITAKALFVSATTSVDLPTTTLFTDDSGIVLTEQGLKVNTKSDTATVNGTLSGDLSVEYVYSQSGYGETEFTFYDKDDPTTKVFSLYRSFSEDKNSGCACVVDYRGSDTAEKILYLGARSWENSFPDKYRFQYNGLGSVSSEVYPSCGFSSFFVLWCYWINCFGGKKNTCGGIWNIHSTFLGIRHDYFFYKRNSFSDSDGEILSIFYAQIQYAEI